MKTSLKKLRGFAGLRHEKKERKIPPSQVHLDELDQATQDMQDMRDCYDRLLSAAAATANSAYEFSESLRELGDCLLEKTALNDDEESGKVLLMLGKVQFELQNLVDSYRSHVSKTITIPSESLLEKLHMVEEMKRECDDKRESYEDMLREYKEKGKHGSNKGESFSSHQLHMAYEEYDEGANIFIFRMKSLKQGQSRSLLTQAARHHAAQLSFFRKAVKSLEAIEPHVRFVTEQQHIDYQFYELEEGSDEDDNDYDDDDDDAEDGSEALDDGELSFDYGQNDQGQDFTDLKNSMELDNADVTFPHVTTTAAAKEHFVRGLGGNSVAFRKEVKPSSKSAPLFADRKTDPAEKLAQLQPSLSRKYHLYELPTPVEGRSPVSGKLETEVSQTRRASVSSIPHNLWHSSPLVQNKYEKLVPDKKLSGPLSVLKESNNTTKSSQLPPPLTEGVSFSSLDVHVASDNKKVKRQALSGPLTGKPWPSKAILSASGPIFSAGYSQPISGSLLRTRLPRPSSTSNLSSRGPSTFTSSPKISELHELPRPPTHLASGRAPNRIAHSGPLVSRSQDLFATNKVVASAAASALPMPPQIVPRSYSIPSRGQIETMLHVSEQREPPQVSNMVEDATSPPLTPLSLLDTKPTTPSS